MIRQLAHLNFVTNDLSRIIDFYVGKLGMEVKFTLNNKQNQPFGYCFGCGNTTFLEFFDQGMAVEVWGGSQEQRCARLGDFAGHGQFPPGMD